ncbi:MAG TPA: GNAT family N-acetyltransferase [Solirubrobacteraceae bacterium]|nr:GNAT family N-acetyltransferase [Solirubrobacteraceae bacterium]
MAQVRKATADDVPALSGALGRAFHDDPVFAWMFPREDARRRWAPRFFDIRVRQLLGQEEVYAVPGIGAAVWAAPERWDLGWRGFADMLPLTVGLGRRTLRAAIGNGRVDRAHQEVAPHWYLAVLGVDPPHQGNGLGTALLAPVLAQCDRDGVGAYLETATERDVAFYSRFGFRVTGELRFPGGPPVWPMWRDPRGG